MNLQTILDPLRELFDANLNRSDVNILSDKSTGQHEERERSIDVFIKGTRFNIWIKSGEDHNGWFVEVDFSNFTDQNIHSVKNYDDPEVSSLIFSLVRQTLEEEVQKLGGYSRIEMISLGSDNRQESKVRLYRTLAKVLLKRAFQGNGQVTEKKKDGTLYFQVWNNKASMKESNNFNDAFWKWFGDSKVVDDQGNPLVCYHGTSRGGFNSFDGEMRHHQEPGFHFGTNHAQANFFTVGNAIEAGHSIYPVYLSIQNPITLRDYGTWESYKVFPQLLDLGIISRKDLGADEDEVLDENFYDAWDTRSMLEELGYDGIKYYNRREGKDFQSHDETYLNMDSVEDLQLQQVHGDNWAYCILDANQAKSIYNKGTWRKSTDQLNESV